MDEGLFDDAAVIRRVAGRAWCSPAAAAPLCSRSRIPTIPVGDPAREIATALLRPRRIPAVLRPAKPVHRFVTIGLLPQPIRAGYGLPWSARKPRLFDRVPSLTSAVCPHLPRAVREVPKDYCLSDLRRRLARHRNPLAADG